MANCVVLVAVRLDDGMRGVAEKAVDAAASMSSSRAEIIVLLVMVTESFGDWRLPPIHQPFLLTDVADVLLWSIALTPVHRPFIFLVVL
jgi:hypothetical protein